MAKDAKNSNILSLLGLLMVSTVQILKKFIKFEKLHLKNPKIVYLAKIVSDQYRGRKWAFTALWLIEK